jgi:hypothetical protein
VLEFRHTSNGDIPELVRLDDEGFDTYYYNSTKFSKSDFQAFRYKGSGDVQTRTMISYLGHDFDSRQWLDVIIQVCYDLTYILLRLVGVSALD